MFRWFDIGFWQLNKFGENEYLSLKPEKTSKLHFAIGWCTMAKRAQLFYSQSVQYLYFSIFILPSILQKSSFDSYHPSRCLRLDSFSPETANRSWVFFFNAENVYNGIALSHNLNIVHLCKYQPNLKYFFKNLSTELLSLCSFTAASVQQVFQDMI